jgi:hypothetical protein
MDRTQNNYQKCGFQEASAKDAIHLNLRGGLHLNTELLVGALRHLAELRRACAEADVNQHSCRRYGCRLAPFEAKIRELGADGISPEVLAAALALITQSYNFIRPFSARGAGAIGK